jgi:hypothetical protein
MNSTVNAAATKQCRIDALTMANILVGDIADQHNGAAIKPAFEF